MILRRPTFFPAILGLLLLPGLAAPALAQTAPRADLFAGYSLLPANGDDFPRQTSHGIEATAAFHVTPWFGVIGDLGVQFSTASDLGSGFAGRVAHTRVTEIMGGPRFTARSDRVDVFGHGLIGWAAGDAGADFEGFSDTKIAFGGGGGVDIHVTPRLAVRAQFDLIGSFADIVEGNTRFGVGMVVRLGR